MSVANPVEAAPKSEAGASWRDWYTITKPRIVFLALVTTFSGMWLAQNGAPPILLTISTLLGTALAAASSAVLNNAFDEEIDQKMVRTRERATARGAIQPGQAVFFGVALGICSVTLFVFAVNEVVAALAVFTISFYALLYTRWLKRTSPWNTSIGGVAGAMPPVMGWLAVRPELERVPVVLFLVLFLWQPPHFYALALARMEEYRAAGIPMFPVVHGIEKTRRRMITWTVVLVATTLAVWIAGLAGPIYGFTALIFGGLYLRKTVAFASEPFTASSSMKLFGFSIVYLSLVYLSFVLDVAG